MKKTSSDFSLRMSEWTESEDSGKENQPHNGFKLLANKKTHIQNAESVSSSELTTTTKTVVPKKTQKKTQRGLFTTSASGGKNGRSGVFVSLVCSILHLDVTKLNY